VTRGPFRAFYDEAMDDTPRTASTLEHTRRTMGRSQDTKVTRTRQAIFEAVAQIADVGSMTVGEVVRRAGISRAAFYTHFAGLDELALAIMRDMLDEVSALHDEARGTTYAGWREASIAMLRRNVAHMVGNRALYLSVLGMPGASGAFQAATDELTASIVTALEHMPSPPARVEVADAARFVASGTLAMIVHWMRSAPSTTVDEMVTRLISLFPDMES
jgi:AcrR family transcriptional regulator